MSVSAPGETIRKEKREMTRIASLLCMLGCLPAAALATPAKDKGVSGTKVPTAVSERIVGTWRAKPDKGLTLVFHKDGSLQVTRKAGKAQVTVAGKYKLLNNEDMEINLTDPKGTGRVFRNAVRIKSLKPGELVLRYRGKFKGAGKEEVFERVK
jgi:uncharacterized protein (TIGR03066 family)